MILTIAFLILAGICKAVSDTITHHFDTSVFRRKDRKFWDPNISWKYAKTLKFTSYKVDAWHLANSGMIISWCFALAFYDNQLNINPFIVVIIAGIIFNLSFNLFYNKILR